MVIIVESVPFEVFFSFFRMSFDLVVDYVQLLERRLVLLTVNTNRWDSMRDCDLKLLLTMNFSWAPCETLILSLVLSGRFMPLPEMFPHPS